MQDYPFHPLAEKYGKQWSEARKARVVADLKKHGFDRTKPIFLYQGQIVIGRNRYHACQVAGVEPRFEGLKLRKGESLEEVIKRDNLERNQYTPEEESRLRDERIEEVVAAKAEGKSNRVIAKEQGVDEKTIRKDLAAAGADQSAPEMPTPDDSTIPGGKVTGKDGKKYAAKKLKLCERCTRVAPGVGLPDCPNCAAIRAKQPKKKAPKAKPEEMNGTTEEPPPPDTDKHGHKIPPKASDAFANLKRFEELDSLVRKVQTGIDELSKLPGGEKLRQHLQPTGSEGKTINKSEHLNALKRDIRFTRPHSVCPHCAAKRPTCTACNGTGWVTETTWKNTEDKVKEKLDVHA